MSTVTIIIPTTCEAPRGPGLLRAIDSLLAQAETSVLVLINGQRYDHGLRAALEGRRDLQVHYLATGSLPEALHTGRQLVRTPYFGFLDDDDEYLPGTVAARLAPLQADTAIAFSVCNGFKCSGGQERLLIDDVEAVRRDPLRVLAESGTWLASCGGLFRTSRVLPEDFNSAIKDLEWTYLAYRLGSRQKLAVVPEPGFRIHETPGSLSSSMRYREGLVKTLGHILALPGLPAHIRHRLRHRLAHAHHDLSATHLAQGQRGQAWRHHLVSLRYPTGWHFLPYTRRLFF